MKLTEKYRPRIWSEVVGQDDVVGAIHRLRQNGGLAGRCYWISGKTGTGKTTIAHLLAAELAGRWDTVEVSAGTVDAKQLQAIEHFWHLRPLSGGYVLLVNEAHRLHRGAVGQLLVMTDEGRMPPHCTVIYTTTVDGNTVFEGVEDGGPLLSRCTRLALSQRSGKLFAARLRDIAQTEGLDSKPVQWYVDLMGRPAISGNFRAALQHIEKGDTS